MSVDTAGQPRQAKGSVSPKLIIALVIAALALTFIFQNTAEGRVHFLFWTIEMPAWLWLIIIFAAGLIVGSVFPWLRRGKKKPDAA